MLRAPIIGITCEYHSRPDRAVLPVEYARAIEASGGIPFLLPVSSSEAALDLVAGHIDGLLLSGGADIDPFLYGEEPAVKLGRLSPERDRTEMGLCRRALAGSIPILAICRGVQVLNVCTGGTLYQDIESEIRGAIKHHQEAPGWYPTHGVDLRSGTKTASICGSPSIRVNSFHHQGIRLLGRGLLNAGEAEDGIIEAVEALEHPFAIGVQWHPEEMWESHPPSRNLFRALVEMAGAMA